MKEFIRKLLGIKCWHKWEQVYFNDWYIEERCVKCGNSALRINP